MKKLDKDKMPDVTKHSSSLINSRIEWVGMDNISVPIQVEGEQVLSHANVYVNITDPSAKGIHMSRLYLCLGKNLIKRSMSVDTIKSVMTELMESQSGLSDQARLELTWKQPLNRKALLSDYSGWKSYPVKLKVVKKIIDNVDQWVWNLEFSLFYSSTCPCSAALSRQLFQNQFEKDFSKDALNYDEVMNWIGNKQVASAHSQRSRADIRLTFKTNQESVDFVKYIDTLEKALSTPVQTAVKREDEQEFARLNGENLMFVEDALRKMKKSLSDYNELKDFVIKTRHFESLHDHDAAGIIRK